MTSKPPDGCFVYMTLPGETAQVVAARFEIRESRSGKTGRLVYGRSYLERKNAVEIDPVDLTTLDGRTYGHSGDSPLFPSLRDALPDHWGRLVIARAEGGELDDIGYLLRSSDDRAGALGFGLNPVPPSPAYAFNKMMRLKELVEAADAILADRDADPELVKRLEQLNLVGTSMGGARPKAVVEDDDGLWIAKFPKHDDRFDMPRAEHAMLLLAREAGISAADSRLQTVGDRSVLLVKRFDREKTEAGYQRHRMISGLTALQASASATHRDRWSYPLLADVLGRIDADHSRSKPELFRRVVYSALISNSDDHPRNHALIADGRGWRLSPAYDLVPNPQVAQYDRVLAMRIGDEGRLATASNLVSASPRFGVPHDEAKEIVSAMRELVSGRWYQTCKSVGMTEADCGLLAGSFDFEGFQPETNPWAKP